MTPFVSKIRDSISQHGLLNSDDHVIVTLSGGADSVALLSALVSLGYKCTAAHCNFHLRGEESDRDCRYALEISGSMGVHCIVKDFNVPEYEHRHKVSTEMACRELRYAWFEHLRQSLNAQAIAVAHHRDDNIETFFLNLLRGTGIAGLSGMAPRNGYIIRPMLNCSRDEVEEYLRLTNTGFVTDSTNLQNDYRRNRLRNIVIKTITSQFPEAKDSIASTIAMLRENEGIYQRYIDLAREKYIQGDTLYLTPLIDNEPQAKTLLFELIRPWGFNITHVNDIIASAKHSGRQFHSGDTSLILNRGELIITHHNESRQDECLEYIIDLSQQVSSPITLETSISTNTGDISPTDCNSILLDSNVLDGSPRFTLRRWRKGDRILPYGMRGSKKLSDIFSDAKLSLREKSQIWVLTRNDDILWVVGMRASRLFQVAPSSKNILTITLK